jgi:tetratricopeptide (TPR) repeat protein
VKEKSWLALPKMPKMPWQKKSASSSRSPRKQFMSDRPADPNKMLEGQVAVARLSERRGQTQQAEMLYRGLLQKHSDLAAVHHRLGVIEARRRNFEAADKHLQKALADEPENVELLVDAGYCCYLQNRYEEAEDLYRRGCQLARDNVALCNNYGILLGELGRFDEALVLFRQVNSEPEAHTNLGFVMTQIGDYENARKAFLLALSLDPKQRKAAHALLQLDEHQRHRALVNNQNQPTDPATPTDPQQVPSAPPTGAQEPAALVQSGRPINQLPNEGVGDAATTIPNLQAVLTQQDSVPSVQPASPAMPNDAFQPRTPDSIAENVSPDTAANRLTSDAVVERVTPDALAKHAAPGDLVHTSQDPAISQGVYRTSSDDQNLTAAPIIVPASHRQGNDQNPEHRPRPSQMQVPAADTVRATPATQVSVQPRQSSRRSKPVVVGDLPKNTADRKSSAESGTPAEPSTLPSLPNVKPVDQQAPAFGLHYNLNPHSQVQAQAQIPKVGKSDWPQPALPLLPSMRQSALDSPEPGKRTDQLFRR